MAMILSMFVTRFVKLLVDYGKEEAVMILGIPDEIKRLRGRLERLQDFLTNAEARRLKDHAINHWLNELRDVMYDADDIIDECRIEGAKHIALQSPSSSSRSSDSVSCCYPPISCFSRVGFRHELGKKIKSLNRRLDDIFKDMTALSLLSIPRESNERRMVISRSTSPLVEPDLVGERIGEDTRSLVDMLVDNEHHLKKQKIEVLAILGMGGIGKTTLAQNIFNDERLQAEFIKMPPIWVCVSQDFSEIDLLRVIITRAGGNPGEAKDKADLEPMLSEVVRNKKFFLVLDDVWDAAVWDNLLKKPLQSALAGSKVLVTTRHEAVAKQMAAVYCHQVEKLSDEDGWTFLCKMVFQLDIDEGDMQQALRDTGMRIVQKCDGLPLAIKTIAGVLRTKERRQSEWQKVLHNPAWSLTELPEGVMGALYLSYEDLPSHLKQCFVYFALFPEDALFDETILCALWIAEGFLEAEGSLMMEELAEASWKELVQRNLLQSQPGWYSSCMCKMHDLLHSLAKFLARGECFCGGMQEFNLISPISTSTRKPRRVCITAGAINDELVSVRTLIAPGISGFPEEDTKNFRCLRIFNMTDSTIEKLPNSLGRLVHLRYLNLARSHIRELPESIGDLRNLQFLLLTDCKQLHSLPKSIVKLLDLRCLGAYGTQLDGVPMGIGSLHHLTTLKGFTVFSSHANGKDSGHCTLEEIGSLSHLRYLHACKLERAYIGGYFGLDYPSWMMLMPSSILPNLRRLDLENCNLCKQLPPLGMLPQLDYLRISGSSAVTSIGPELFLDGGNADGRGTCICFPRLKEISFEDMPNWEEWLWLTREAEDYQMIVVLPCLEQLTIKGCPRLQCLPEGLFSHSASLASIRIEGAHSLKEIKNLLYVKELILMSSPFSVRVSNLPSLKILLVIDCNLRELECVSSLQYIRLAVSEMDTLPDWLLAVGERQESQGSVLKELYFEADTQLLFRCLRGGLEWHKIRHIPRVIAYNVDDSEYHLVHQLPLHLSQ